MKATTWFFKEVILGFFKEGSPWSSKRLGGLYLIFVGGTMGVIDGFHFYDIDNDIFKTMMYVGATLLGVTVLGNIASKIGGGKDKVQ